LLNLNEVLFGPLEAMRFGAPMTAKIFIRAFGLLCVLSFIGFAFLKRDQILFWFEPDGSRVVLVQYVMEFGHQKSRAAGLFDSFEECEKERERLPIGGGFVLGGVCVRVSQWKDLSR
jgi:hypothetical protein